MKHIITPEKDSLKLQKQAISRVTGLANHDLDQPGTDIPTTNISYIADCFSAIALNCPNIPTA
jgi:hypothetical protein